MPEQLAAAAALAAEESAKQAAAASEELRAVLAAELVRLLGRRCRASSQARLFGQSSTRNASKASCIPWTILTALRTLDFHSPVATSSCRGSYVTSCCRSTPSRMPPSFRPVGWPSCSRPRLSSFERRLYCWLTSAPTSSHGRKTSSRCSSELTIAMTFAIMGARRC